MDRAVSGFGVSVRSRDTNYERYVEHSDEMHLLAPNSMPGNTV
jgi:hypothetical protein